MAGMARTHITQSLIHSLTDTFTHTHSLTHPLTHSPTHPLTHSPTHPLTHSPTHPLTHSPTYPLTHSPTHPLTHSPTHPLTNSPTYPLTHSPTHPLTHSPLLTHLTHTIMFPVSWMSRQVSFSGNGQKTNVLSNFKVRLNYLRYLWIESRNRDFIENSPIPLRWFNQISSKLALATIQSIRFLRHKSA